MDNYNNYINSTTTHYVSNSPSDENRRISGGVAGDQTGTEWQLVAWYSMPWDMVIRYSNNKNVGMKMAELACAAALNPKIGYDQGDRYTYWLELQKVQYDPSRIANPCEVDCSAGVLANAKATGYILGIPALQQVSIYGYTGSQASILQQAGFVILTDPKYLTSPDYLLPGDILLKKNAHTCTNVSYGAKVRPAPTVTQKIPNESYSGKGIGAAVAKTTMKVRNKSNILGDVVGYVNTNQAVEVLETLSNGWYKIVWPGVAEGYAYTSNAANLYYKFTKNQPVVENKSYNITPTTDLYARKGPGTSYAINGITTPGKIYTVVEESMGWGRLSNGIGWVSLKYTKKV